ncbi:MAG: hypothetical protein MUF15_02925 [Acidobacteria bacterium]|jgi:hypothetical protein|nr:hypothetical protein [Acidobacteriota bacterium]
MTIGNSKNILDTLMSNDLFKGINTAALVQWFDISSALRDGNLAAKPSVAPIPQKGTTISSIPPEGILITTPGEYLFADNISWNPTTPCSAITIQANGVVLDLKGFALSVNPPTQNPAQQYNGISVESSNGIAVQNGTINGVSYYGLNVSKAIGISISNIIVSNIRYVETTIKDITPCGIFIDSSDEFSIQNCKVQDISVTTPSCAGIQIIESTKGKVANCVMSNFLNNDGGVQGFSYILCSEVLTQSCTSQNFQAHYQGLTKTTGHTVIGYVPIFCNKLEYNDCSVADMTGCCDDSHGMSVFLDSNVEVNNFNAKNVIDGVAPVNTGAKATGLEVYGIEVSINNCSVENIKAIRPQNLQGAGFSAWGSLINFTNCTASNVKVLDENKQPNTAFGYGTGFGWAPDPRFEFIGALFVKYDNCKSIDCQVGFDTWNHIDSIWENVDTQCCPIPILVERIGTSRTLSMDNCSESPSGMPETLTIKNMAKGNVYPPLGIKNQSNGVAFPPLNAGSSWNVPRVSLPGLFSIQPKFQKEWWYYVGTVYSETGITFSIQLQILRESLNPLVSLVGSFAGIGWKNGGNSNFLFGQSYGLGASECSSKSALGNALVIPPVSDNNFSATLIPLVEIVGQSIDPLRDIKLDLEGAHQFNFKYLEGSTLGCINGKYSIEGKGTGYKTIVNSAATTETDYAISLQVVDQRGTVMEGVSGYVGPDMFAPGANSDAPGSYECAQPFLSVTGGTITIGNETYNIEKGNLWMDRQMVQGSANNSSIEQSAIPQNIDEFKTHLLKKLPQLKSLYLGDWMGISLNTGVSIALAEFWQKSDPQWITGTKVGKAPKNGFGNLFFKTEESSAPINNGGMYLKPRLNMDDKDWDFDINILNSEPPQNSPHWESPISHHTYATAWEIEFSIRIQQYGLPDKLYVFAICENSENVLPGKIDSFFEGAALAYDDKDQKTLVGYVFVEQMGFN